MSIREHLNENPQHATIAAVVAIGLVAVIFWTRSRGGGPAGGERYFFDLNTGVLVAGPEVGASPLDLGNGTYKYPDGTAGSAVLARVFSCDGCNGVAVGMKPEELKAVNAKVGFLSRYSMEEKAVLDRKTAGETMAQILDGNPAVEFMPLMPLISSTDGEVWLPDDSPPAVDLQRSAYEGCPGNATPTVCRP